MPYAAIEIEGLFPADLIERVATGEVEGQRATDFGLAAGARLADELQSAYSDVRAHWDAFQRRLAHSSASATTITREAWAAPLLERLGYALRFQRGAEAGGESFAISHRAGDAEDAPPVNIVSIGQRLDARADGSRRSPHAAVQEFLNRSDVAWGIVTNGERLRLLRDAARLARPTYLEFGLQAIVEDNLYSEFVLLYRLLHRTRLPQTSADTPECLIERYYQRGIEEGGRVRDRLREGVEKALLQLANGLFTNPASEALRARVVSGDLRAGDLYRQLLRLVYRLLFLMVVEERRLMFPPGASSAGPDVYLRHYGLTTLRERADRYTVEEPYDDLWQQLVRIFEIFRDEAAASTLGLVPFDGDLFAASACPDLEPARCLNAPLLRAIRHLSTFTEGNVPRRVNFAALDVEELGSVYESLLDYEPHLDAASPPRFSLEPGSERRATGSYYTPPELVHELIEGALVPVMGERLAAARDDAAREQALLGLRVLDLAAGSGHFLLATGRRIARELARLRARGDEPTPTDFRRALREVIRSCLYAVDKNPLAVDLCKVALWLESHEAGLPLAFLDHRVKLGDSLVGVADLGVLDEGIPDEAYERADRALRTSARALRERNRLERVAGQQPLVAQGEDDMNKQAEVVEAIAREPDDSVQRVREHAERYSTARGRGGAWWREQVACDLWTAPFFADIRAPVPTTATLQAFRADPSAADGSLIGAVAEIANGRTLFHWPIEFPEAAAAGGFDVVLSNPPFMGGTKISTNFGDDYRHYLLTNFPPAGGTADLCAFFFRRAYALLRPGGRLGMIGTKTLHEGDTRVAGLALIIDEGGTITSARRSVEWPLEASVRVDLVSIRRGRHTAQALLDGRAVAAISSRLDEEGEGVAVQVSQNTGKAFLGSYVLGMGFVLEPAEAQALIARDPRNRECLFPYLNGEDLNSRPDQSPSRWVIQFDERDEAGARSYPDLWRIVEQRVWPDRSTKDRKKYPRMVDEWWKHWNNRRDLYREISQLTSVFVRARVSEYHMLYRVPVEWIYSDQVIVFAFDDDYHFGILQSNIHEAWVRRYASSLESRNRYTPTDCFENFPFPQDISVEARRAVERAARAYEEHRAATMRSRGLGLTKTYNLVNDERCRDDDICRLRDLHAEVDRAVLACYGWADLELGHGFHPNERGQARFTISPDARRDLLRRLLALNAEVARREREEAARPKWERVG